MAGTIQGDSQANASASKASESNANVSSCSPSALPSAAQRASESQEVGYQGWSLHFQDRAVVRGIPSCRIRRPTAMCHPESLSLTGAKQNGPASNSAQANGTAILRTGPE